MTADASGDQEIALTQEIHRKQLRKWREKRRGVKRPRGSNPRSPTRKYRSGAMPRPVRDGVFD